MTIQNWSDASAISPDGRQVLLNEEGADSGRDYDVYVRASDGAAPDALAMAMVTISRPT